jgi:hypothetical protein
MNASAVRRTPSSIAHTMAPFLPLAELLGVTAALENGFAELTGEGEPPCIYAARFLSIGLDR